MASGLINILALAAEEERLWRPEEGDGAERAEP
jgi:hypothetical protein